MSRDPAAHRLHVNDDAWFVDDCLFGRCGADAQQACEDVVNQLALGEPWDHIRIAEGVLAQLRRSQPPTASKPIPGLRGVAVGQVYQQLSTSDRFEVTELRQARPSGGWSATLRNLRTGRDGWNWCDSTPPPTRNHPPASRKPARIP